MWKEFRDFAMRGNVIDLAVGIVIGAAFGKIVSSLVNDIVMPPVGVLLGKVDFSNLFVSLSGDHYASLADAKNAGAATLNYGIFINNIVDFVIVALAIFILVRQVNRFAAKPQPASPTTKECPYCVCAINVRATRCPQCTAEIN